MLGRAARFKQCLSNAWAMLYWAWVDEGVTNTSESNKTSELDSQYKRARTRTRESLHSHHDKLGLKLVREVTA